MLRKLIISCIFVNMTLNIALDMAAASDNSYLSGGALSFGSENAGRIGLGLGANLPAGFKNGGTQNYQLAPKYLTQKLMRAPKIITENVVQPIYKRVINRPSILRERYVSIPNMIPSAGKMFNRKRILGIQAQTSNLTKQVNVPGNTVTLQKVITPTLLIRNDRVKVLQSQPQVQKNAAIMLPVRARTSQEFRSINVPGGTIHNRTFIQPTFSKEYVQVNVQRQPTRRINHQPVTAPVVIQTRIRNKRVVVPGRRIMNQSIIQPRHTSQRVRVNLIQSQPVRITRAPIIKPTIKRRNVKRKYHNIVYKVPIQRTITKVEPHILKVDDVSTVFVPVDENGQELTGASAANVLDQEGFVFGKSGYANSYAGKSLADSVRRGGAMGNINLGKWSAVGSMPVSEGMGGGQWRDLGANMNFGADMSYGADMNYGADMDLNDADIIDDNAGVDFGAANMMGNAAILIGDKA